MASSESDARRKRRLGENHLHMSKPNPKTSTSKLKEKKNIWQIYRKKKSNSFTNQCIESTLFTHIRRTNTTAQQRERGETRSQRVYYAVEPREPIYTMEVSGNRAIRHFLWNTLWENPHPRAYSQFEIILALYFKRNVMSRVSNFVNKLRYIYFIKERNLSC